MMRMIKPARASGSDSKKQTTTTTVRVELGAASAASFLLYYPSFYGIHTGLLLNGLKAYSMHLRA